MEIKVVYDAGKKSKYNDFWIKLFNDESIEELKKSIEKIRGRHLGLVIDLAEINTYGNRKNKINERGYITENGQITAYGSIAKSLAAYLKVLGINNIYFTIKESNDSIDLTIKDLNIHRLKHKSFK